jgi:FdhD protein
MDQTAKREVNRLSGTGHEVVEDFVVLEQPVQLFLNGEQVLATDCSPGSLRALAYGYMFSEGIINTICDVFSYQQQNGKISVVLKSVSSSRSPTPITSDFRMSAKQILEAAKTTNHQAKIFKQTGGTHVVYIFDESQQAVLVEDISRTCALEKAIGKALMSGLSFERSMIFLSSRLPGRMLKKIGRCGIPIVGCVSAPTCQAIDLARKLGISLCGFVRGEKLNVYSHMERITQ